MSPRHALALLLTGVLTGCGGGVARGDSGLVRVERTPDDGILPEVSVGADGAVHLVSLHGAAAAAGVRYRKRSLTDTSWSSPVALDPTPGSGMAIGTVRGAHLAVGRRGLVHVLWNGSSAVTTDARVGAPLLYARVDGRTVTPARNLMSDSVSLDGGGAIAADGEGHVYALWHANPPLAKRDAERTAFLVVSDDDGDRFGPARVASPPASGACACCGMAALARPGRSLLWMFRAATDDRGRDVHLMRRDGDGASTVVMEDPWELEACPLSTSTIADSPLGALAAWETRGQIHYADVPDGGMPLGGPQTAPGGTGRRRHPAVARNGAGDLLLAWTEGAAWGRGGDLEWVVLERGTRRELAAGRVPAIPTWTKPAAYATPTGTFVLLY